MNRRQTLKGLLLAPIAALIKPKPKEPEKPKEVLRFNGYNIEAWNGKKWQSTIRIVITDNGYPSLGTRNSINTEVTLEIPIEK